MRRACLVGVLGLLACGGDPPTDTVRVASVELSPTALTLRLAESRGLSALAYDAQRRVVSSPMTWATSAPAVATVSSTGTVTAVAVGNALITASSGGKQATAQVTVERQRVARVLLGAGIPEELLVGATALFRATGFDADGLDAVGWTPAWSVADTTVARIDASGLLRAVGGGTTLVRAVIDTAAITTSVRVRAALDLRVTGLAMAQAIQDEALSIPMVRGGLPVLLSTWVTADAPLASNAWVRASCADDTGEVWRDSTRLAGPHEISTRPAFPSAQWLLPNARIGSGLSCHVVADPAAIVPDTSRSNNRFPPSGGRRFTVTDVPPLDITFIPVVLGGDGGVIGNVNPGNVEQYLATTRQQLPVGVINSRVGAPYTTNVVFGSGQDAAWRAILREIEARRIVDGSRGHYYGVLRPPQGVTFVQFSGFGFISGRSAVSVQVGWFNRESQARETVAHELGHNFGRPHSPCGGPSNPDPAYPYAEADIGIDGWDAWTASQGGRGEYQAPGSKDLMSYCRPVWISDYTFRKVIEGREALASAALAGAGGRMVLVRGELGTVPRLDAPFVLDRVAARPALRPGQPSVAVDVVDGAGRVVGTGRVGLLAPDHGGPPSFAGVVPVADGEGVHAVRVRVTDGGLVSRRLAVADAPEVRVVTLGDSTVQLSWDARAVPDLMVRDARSGEVLAFASGGLARVRVAGRGIAVRAPGGSQRELPR